MARRTLPQSTKDGILDGLRNGVKPTELAVTYGVSIPTIYNFRKRAVVAAVTPALETVPTVEAVVAPVKASKTR